MAELTDEKDPLEQGSKDPFDPENVGAFQLIATMRVYDVLMAMYRDVDKTGATKLEALHKDGKVLGSFPWLDLTQGAVEDE